MGIKALYPKIKTIKANKEHYKYPYLLNKFKNDKGANNKSYNAKKVLLMMII